MPQNNKCDALIEDEFNKQHPYDDMDGWDRKLFKSGYQAATKASESEINSLKERVAELSNLLKDRQSDLDFEFNRAEQNELECNALTEDNIQLREALYVSKQFITEAIIDDKYHEANYSLDELYLLRDKAIHLYNSALSSTPTQSLVEHDNEVIEGCAKVCDYYAVNAFNSSSRNAAIELAVAIRNIEYEKLEGK